MHQTLINALKTVKSLFGDKSRDELYRDEFERKAVASPEFKLTRFARSDDGTYCDANLERAWRTFVKHEKIIDDAI